LRNLVHNANWLLTSIKSDPNLDVSLPFLTLVSQFFHTLEPHKMRQYPFWKGGKLQDIDDNLQVLGAAVQHTHSSRWQLSTC
jgi:hypothetical protein